MVRTLFLTLLFGCHAVTPVPRPTTATPNKTADGYFSALCAAPIALVDTSQPTHVVGTGTAASCTEDAVRAAVSAGGMITFSCGSTPTTIAITTQLDLGTTSQTTIDGGGLVTLDGGGHTRLFAFDHGDYRKNTVTVTLQKLTLANAASTGPQLANGNPGYDLVGGGGAIYVRDGVLHVIDCTFTSDRAPLLGPDVGGGAIYATGSLDVTVVGSHFDTNTASNGGAIGALNTTLTIANSDFTNNVAAGHGENYIDSQGNEAGEGGNGGAVVIDGGSNGTVSVCGATFTGNNSHGLGAALFRTVDAEMQPMLIDRSSFTSNATLASPVTSEGDGDTLYLQNVNLSFTNSVVLGNQAHGGGAGLRIEGTSQIAVSNSTFANNKGSGLGIALSLSAGTSGTLTNITVANNDSGAFIAGIFGGDGKVSLTNSIVASNTASNAVGPNPLSCGKIDGGPKAEALLGGTGTLQFPGTGNDFACAPSPKIGDAKLAVAADNHGPTFTMAPAAGSPALGLGRDCPPFDQRGKARAPDKCTAGAFEAD